MQQVNKSRQANLKNETKMTKFTQKHPKFRCTMYTTSCFLEYFIKYCFEMSLKLF